MNQSPSKSPQQSGGDLSNHCDHGRLEKNEKTKWFAILQVRVQMRNPLKLQETQTPRHCVRDGMNGTFAARFQSLCLATQHVWCVPGPQRHLEGLNSRWWWHGMVERLRPLRLAKQDRFEPFSLARARLKSCSTGGRGNAPSNTLSFGAKALSTTIEAGSESEVVVPPVVSSCSL